MVHRPSPIVLQATGSWVGGGGGGGTLGTRLRLHQEGNFSTHPYSLEEVLNNLFACSLVICRERESACDVCVCFGRDAVLTLHYCGGSCQCQTKRLYGCWCQPGTDMACCAPSGSEPNGGLMRFIIDESHQKAVITYHFLSVFAYSFSYSCSCSDCTGSS